MDVGITGSHGLIGSALSRALTDDGHGVVPIVRSSGEAKGRHVRWDVEASSIDADALEGLDAVVHLAGAGVASGRWNDEQRRSIRQSRVEGTSLLSDALAGLEDPPEVLISGSAIGYYGDRGDTELDERSAPGDDFLAEVCRDWEAATGPAEQAGIRVAHIRTGVVLSGDGGALAAQLPVFKLGLGGRAGRGDQWLSWISLADEIAAIRFLLERQVKGPVNLTAPTPVTNAEFTETLGSVLHRPTFMVIPRALTRLPAGVGDLVETLLFSSARVRPTVLEGAGYPFRQPRLQGALREALDR